MAIITTSWYNAATGQNFGTGAAWSNLSNMGASDNTYTTASPGAGAGAQFLYIPFTGISLPSGSTLQGIEASAEGNITGDTPLFGVFYLTITGDQVGVEGSDTPSLDWTSSDTTTTYGGASNLWNTSLTKADVESSGFGVVVYVFGGGSAATNWSIDHVRVRFTYDDGVSGGGIANGLMLMGVGV